eukprot:scaffold168_cov53-Attheya_sp.AAC.1
MNDDGDKDLDDFAFLDAQIEKVQTSHGRTVEAKGKGYRSIINGILIAPPPDSASKKKDAQSSSALQKKLKASQDDRKAKSKSKKK